MLAAPVVVCVQACGGMIADVGDGSADGQALDTGLYGMDSSIVHPPPSDAQPPPLPDGGPGICAPASLGGYVFAWHAPRPPSPSCVGTDVVDMYQACFDPKLQSSQKCSAFQMTHNQCFSCVMSKDTDPFYGAMVARNFTLRIFAGGCVATILKDPSPAGCGARVEDAYQCADYSCRGCPLDPNDPPTFDAYAKCFQAAQSTTCAKYQAVANQCVGNGPAAACVAPDFATSFKATATAICGG